MPAPVPPDPAEPARVGLWLSGGGIRAALCAAGAVEQLRRIGWHDRIVRVVSVSGGAIANGAMVGVPADGLVRALHDVIRRVRRRWRILGSLAVAVAGSLWILVFPFQWSRTMAPEREWLSLGAIGVALLVMAIAAPGRVWLPAVLLAAGLARAHWLPDPPGWLPWGVMAVWGLVAWWFVRGRRDRRRRASTLHRTAVLRPHHTVTRTSRWRDDVVGSVVGSVLAVALGVGLVVAWLGGVFGPDALQRLGWGLLALAILQFAVWPMVHRSMLDWVLGGRDVTIDTTVRGLDRRHVFATTDATTGDPALVLGGGPEPAIAVGYPGDERVEPAKGDTVLTVVQASTAMVALFPPVVPVGIGPADTADRVPPDVALPERFLLLADAGLNGTLGRYSAEGLDDLAVRGVDVGEPPDLVIHLDAANPTEGGSWLGYFVPVVRGLPFNYYQARALGITLRDIVRRERVDVDREGDPVVRARASRPDEEPFATAARFGHWCPSRRQAMACRRAGRLAVQEAIDAWRAEG